MSESYDVVVVGAGPAGAWTAKCLADAGLSVYCIEKRQEIGAPKRCGEGFAYDYFKELGLNAKQSFTCHKVTGLIFHSPNDTTLKFTEKFEVYGGYILERKVFDKYVATLAARAGVNVQAKTRCIGLLREGNRVGGIRAESFGEEFEVKAKIVVAADGVDSKVARWAGLPSVQKMHEYESGIQFEMANIELEDPNCCEYWCGSNVAPKGYAWAFPKGKDIANIGLMMPITDRRPIEYLKEWIARQERFRHGSVLEVNGGGLPIGRQVKSFVTDGLMAVGDAAHQANPLHGGGIAEGMLAGQILAEVAANAIGEGNVSKKRLSEYDRRWKQKYGRRMANLLMLMKLRQRLSDEQLDSVTANITGSELAQVADGKNIKKIAGILIKKVPVLSKVLMSTLF